MGIRAIDERADPTPNLVATVLVLGGLDGVSIGGPDVGARDFVAVAVDEPPKGRKAGLGGKRRVLLGEIARGPRQRLGIAWGPIREGNRLVEEPGVLRGSEPFALIARCELHQIQQHTSPWPVGYFFATARNHPR